MGKLNLVMFFVLFSFMAISQNLTEKEWFYVGTFTSEGAEGVYLCSFDPDSGSLRLEKVFKGFDNPSFLKISPDRRFLYVVNRSPRAVEPSGGSVSAFRINGDKSLSFLNKQLSHGEDPCHVDVSPDGNFVAVANYGSGSLALYPIEADGKLKPATSVIQNKGTGANPARQSGPHAHSIKFSPNGNEVFSPDLGIDKVVRFELDKGSKTLKATGQPFLPVAPGAGPRHFDFHPAKDILYVINELNSTITCFGKSSGSWSDFQTVSALPPGYSETSYCADIHISKDGKFLYGSNRGHNSIAVFVVEAYTGKLIPIDFVPTQGNWPRNFTLSPDGKYLLVGNQRSGNITVFRINSSTGIPEFTGNELKIPSPVCLEFY